MFNNIKRNLYFSKMQLLFDKGVIDEKIVPFDDRFYEKMNHTYICGLPVAMHIKYLKPKSAPGKCYDKSLYMFFCFNDAILVRGSNQDFVNELNTFIRQIQYDEEEIYNELCEEMQKMRVFSMDKK